MTYLYCLVRSARKPVVRPGRGGLPGAGPPRALDAGEGLWLIVADVEAAEYGEAAIAEGLKDLAWVSRRAIGHEAVVERFLGAAAVLPMKLFTIFTDDDRALAHVAGQRRAIARLLERVEGHVEWGLRLTWNEQGAREDVEKTHRANRRQSGAAYLARKRDLLEVNQSRLSAARAAATKVHRQLTKHARDAVRRTSTERAAPGSRLLLDAAYLVPVTKVRSFRAAVRDADRRLGSSGIVASLTGPWPAYNFISS